MNRRRRHFTLLEMLFVIFLMGLFLGVVGINVNKAVHEQRFRSEVGKVVDTLRIAQNIMLILDNDVHVKFKQEDAGITMQIETSCPLSPGWGKLILTPRRLNTIHIVRLKDKLLGNTSKEGVEDIRFLSSGYVMTQGILRLATADAAGGMEGLESFICLPGYPSTLSSSQKRPSESECFSLLGAGFVENITNQMVGEIAQLKQMEDSTEQKGKTQEGGKDEAKKSK